MKKTKVMSHPDFGECVELDNGKIKALVAPGLGFSLVDFSFEGRQMLDMSRKALFLSCRKGLGPLILPHFNQEGPVPRVDEAGFPHIKALKGLKVSHPFQHGVGRYAAWTFKAGSDYVEGILKGSDRLNHHAVRELAGLDFNARVRYVLGPYQLQVTFDVTSDKPFSAGIHFYYDVVNKATATVALPVGGEKDPVVVSLDQDLDNVYFPPDDKDVARCRLDTESYRLDTFIKTAGEPSERFDSVTVFSPKGASFVCVEPLSTVPGKPSAKTRFFASIGLVPYKK